MPGSRWTTAGDCHCVALTLNWHATELTLEWVQSLLSVQPVTKLVIVDNESDGALSRALAARFPEELQRITLLDLRENRGFAAGMNVGLNHPVVRASPWVLAMNNDARVSESSLRRLLYEGQADGNLAILGPVIKNPDGSLQSRGGVVMPVLGIAKHRKCAKARLDFVTWACVLVRTAALEAVGNLDERFFMYWEDVDFSVRARKIGWNIAVVDGAAAYHQETASRARAGEAIKTYHTWSTILYCRKYGGAWKAGAVAWLLGSMLVQTLRARPRALRAHLRGAVRGTRTLEPAWRSRKLPNGS